MEKMAHNTLCPVTWCWTVDILRITTQQHCLLSRVGTDWKNMLMILVQVWPKQQIKSANFVKHNSGCLSGVSLKGSSILLGYLVYHPQELGKVHVFSSSLVSDLCFKDKTLRVHSQWNYVTNHYKNILSYISIKQEILFSKKKFIKWSRDGCDILITFMEYQWIINIQAINKDMHVYYNV